jgi:hypothetical protein
VAKSWNVDAAITEVDEVARTFTATVTDPNLIIMGFPWLVDTITVTMHLAEDAPMPVTLSDVLLVRTKVAGS